MKLRCKPGQLAMFTGNPTKSPVIAAIQGKVVRVISIKTPPYQESKVATFGPFWLLEKTVLHPENQAWVEYAADAILTPINDPDADLSEDAVHEETHH